MPKAPKNKSGSTVKQRALFTSQPWKCTHHPDHSDITAYVEATGQWEIVATVPTTAGASSEAVASFLCGLVHNHQQNQTLLQAAMEALESVIEEGLNYSTEQTVEHAMETIKRTIPK